MHELDIKSKNAQGFSLYPKLVYPHGAGGDPVKVLNIKHEQEVLGVQQPTKEPEPVKQPVVSGEPIKPTW